LAKQRRRRRKYSDSQPRRWTFFTKILYSKIKMW